MIDSNGTVMTSAAFSGNNIASFGEDVTGELYVVGISSGTVFKLIDTTLSSSNFQENTFTITSSSTRGSFIIKSETIIFSSITVFDVSGKKIQILKPSNKFENNIGLSTTVSGVYFLRLQDTNGATYHSKVVVN
jgi:hypothetical protein